MPPRLQFPRKIRRKTRNRRRRKCPGIFVRSCVVRRVVTRSRRLYFSQTSRPNSPPRWNLIVLDRRSRTTRPRFSRLSLRSNLFCQTYSQPWLFVSLSRRFHRTRTPKSPAARLNKTRQTRRKETPQTASRSCIKSTRSLFHPELIVRQSLWPRPVMVTARIKALKRLRIPFSLFSTPALEPLEINVPVAPKGRQFLHPYTRIKP